MWENLSWCVKDDYTGSTIFSVKLFGDLSCIKVDKSVICLLKQFAVILCVKKNLRIFGSRLRLHTQQECTLASETIYTPPPLPPPKKGWYLLFTYDLCNLTLPFIFPFCYFLHNFPFFFLLVMFSPQMTSANIPWGGGGDIFHYKNPATQLAMQGRDCTIHVQRPLLLYCVELRASVCSWCHGCTEYLKGWASVHCSCAG